MNSASETTTPIPQAHFFTRTDCCLCDRAYPILRRLAAEGLLEVTQVDIATDPSLLEKYKHRIPVVQLSTGHVYEGRISEFRLRRALRTQNRQTEHP